MSASGPPGPLVYESALLTLLFHSKMSFTCKNPEIIPRLLRSLGFYMLINVFIQGAPCKASQFFISISAQLVLLSHQLSCLFTVNFLFLTIHSDEF